MISEFLVISDLHLEKKKVVEKEFLLNVINEKIKVRKNNGYNPIIVIPGDLDNGTNGLDFLSKINAQVVYLCGNHEFWNNDYEQLRKEMKNNLPSNVKFLDNDFIIINDFLFVGGTMWSDLGKDFNPDLYLKTKLVMNDEFYITCNDWYKDKKNIEKIENGYLHYAKKFIEKKQWNIFIEREENEKTINYLNNFIEMYCLYESIAKFKERLNTLYENENSYVKINKDDYQDTMKILMSYKNEMNIHKWYNDLPEDIKNDLYKIKNENIEEKNKIFIQLSNQLLIEDIDNIKLVGVSHHLPFLEERLIGREDFFEDDLKNNYFKELKKSIYSLNKGTDYGITNYFYRISKGEFSKDNSINQVLHYSNDGSNNFSSELIEKIDIWIHGHEHAYNYEDNLKGIKIITNPLGYALDILKFNEDNTISLRREYKTHYDISDDEELSNIKNITSYYLRESNNLLSKEDRKVGVRILLLKKFDWKHYNEEIDFLLMLNEKLFNLINSIKDFKINKENYYDIKLLLNGINHSLEKMNNMEDNLSEGVLIRNLNKYSFTLKYADALKKDTVLSLFKPPIQKIDMLDVECFNDNDFEAYNYVKKVIYENIYFLNKSKFIIEKVENLLNNYNNISKLSDISKEIINDFSLKFDDLQSENSVSIVEKNQVLNDFYKLHAKKGNSNKFDF